MTKEQIIAEFKAQYPSLTYGINDEVFEMSPEQYEATIESWADARIAKIQAQAETQAKRQALLDKLGITEEEARLLLGGN